MLLEKPISRKHGDSVKEIAYKMFGLPGLVRVFHQAMGYDEKTDTMHTRVILARRVGTPYPGRPGEEVGNELESMLAEKLNKPGDAEGFIKISRADVLGQGHDTIAVWDPKDGSVPDDVKNMHTRAVVIDTTDYKELQYRLDEVAKDLEPTAKGTTAMRSRVGSPAFGR